MTSPARPGAYSGIHLEHWASTTQVEALRAFLPPQAFQLMLSTARPPGDLQALRQHFEQRTLNKLASYQMPDWDF